MTIETFVTSIVLGSGLSFALEVIPGLRELWGSSTKFRQWKPLVLLILAYLGAILPVLLVCGGDLEIGIDVTCEGPIGLQEFINAIPAAAAAFASMQVTYKPADQLGKKLEALKETEDEGE